MNNRVIRARNTAQAPDRVQVAEQAVHGLLRHLARSACFPAPRVLHAGNGEYGTATLTWIEGTPPAPTAGRTSSPRPAYGRGHGSCAATTTQSSVTARPRPACGPAASGPRARRDHLARRLRPVKSVWRDGKIAGLIAWAPARPALFDVACALEHAAPFRDDEECARWLRYPRPPSRRCRIEVFHGACSIADPGERQCPRRPAAAHGRRHLRGPRPPRHRTAGHPGPRRPPGKSRAHIAWTEASGL